MIQKTIAGKYFRFGAWVDDTCDGMDFELLNKSQFFLFVHQLLVLIFYK